LQEISISLIKIRQQLILEKCRFLSAVQNAANNQDVVAAAALMLMAQRRCFWSIWHSVSS